MKVNFNELNFLLYQMGDFGIIWAPVFIYKLCTIYGLGFCGCSCFLTFPKSSHSARFPVTPHQMKADKNGRSGRVKQRIRAESWTQENNVLRVPRFQSCRANVKQVQISLMKIYTFISLESKENTFGKFVISLYCVSRLLTIPSSWTSN